MELSVSYGPLTDAVTGATAAVAAAGAIGLTWRGRAKWEPAESDLPKGPEKVGGLLGAVAIAIIWFSSHRLNTLDPLVGLAIASAVVALTALLVYSYLIILQTYVKEVAVSETSVKEEKIIGGFWLTERAREAQRDAGPAIQPVLRGMAYDPDMVWPRSARALASLAFIVSYLALTVGGTVALAAAGFLIAPR